MVYIYYHIYAVDGVEQIINEQLDLIKKHFDFPYILNVGISIGIQNYSTSNLFKMFDNIRDIRAFGNEFTTLDLIEEDKEKFGDSDYILYIHTKGASKINDVYYSNLIDWRHLMNYFNIERIKDVFKIFEKTKFNTYGINFHSPAAYESKLAYFGNFWWAKSNYIKTINMENVDKSVRVNSEFAFIQNGMDWKPFCAFNSDINHYYTPYPKEKYR